MDDRKSEEKIEKRLQKLEEENQKLQEEVEELKDTSNQSVKKPEERTSVSRRDFLRKAGLGAAGLAALGLVPGSALNIRDSSGLQVFSGGSKNLDLQPNGDLNLKDNSLTDVDQINGKDVSQLGSGGVSNPLQNNLDANNQNISSIESLTANQIQAQTKLEIPNRTSEPSENNNIWIQNNQLKVKINEVVYTAKISSILTEDLLFKYDFSETSSTTSVPDATGQKPDLTGGSFATSTKNGVQVADFSGSANQELSASFDTTESLPIHVFFVCKIDSASNSPYVWSHNSEGWHSEGSSGWSWYNNTSMEFGNADTEWHIFNMYIEPSRFTHRVDGQNSFSNGDEFKTTDTNSDFTELMIGGWINGDIPVDGKVALLLAYDGDKRNKQAQIEETLADIYNITI